MSGMSRRKGMAWQQQLAKRWHDNGLYPDAYSTGTGQARGLVRVGPKPADIEGTPWRVEAKHDRAVNPVGALRQAEAERDAAKDTRVCIAVVKPHGDRVGPVVCMRLADFEALILAQREGYEST